MNLPPHPTQTSAFQAKYSFDLAYHKHAVSSFVKNAFFKSYHYTKHFLPS